jgi:acyl-CoA thioesterase I
MRRVLSVLLLASVLAAPVPSRAGSEADQCTAPDEFVTADESFDDVGAAIAKGGPVAILAIGSATTVGSINRSGQPTSATETFPGVMLHALETALPNVSFTLNVAGGRGMTAEDMLPLIRSALQQQHYALVIWQTGTVEAVRGLRPDGMQDVLHDGVQLVRDAGADVVLIDPQFSRFLRANTDLDAYEGVMQQVATMPGVTLFRRFELMRTWANDGRVDLERTEAADRAKALDLLNRCLGQALARYILSGVDTARK